MKGMDGACSGGFVGGEDTTGTPLSPVTGTFGSSGI